MYLNAEITRRELKAVARGRVSRVPVPILIQYTLNYLMRDSVAAPVRNDEVRWCEALYRLTSGDQKITTRDEGSRHA